MKNVICLIFIMFIFMTVDAERLIVHVNDTWEYSYEKTSGGYSSTGPLENETISGIIVWKVDSIITNPDHETILYVTKSDSIQKSNTRSGPSTIKTSLQVSYKISGDTVVEIISGSILSKIHSPYFSYWQLPDTSWASSTQWFERKTIVKDTLVNATSSKMRNQTSLSSRVIRTSSYESSDKTTDTLVWLDSIGLFQQVSYNSKTSIDDLVHSLISTQSIEHITLTKRNGKEINQYRTKTINPRLRFDNTFCAKAKYFSINGCLHAKLPAAQVTNRLIVQINTDHHSGSKKILQLCK